MRGEVHAAQAPPSIRHSKVEPASVAVNAKVGVLSFVGPDGPVVISVSGGVVSGAATVKVRPSGVWSVFPAGSVARTSKVWSPTASVAVVCGDVQTAHGPSSTRHSNVEPVSVEVKAKVGVLSLIVVPLAGPLVMVVAGAAVSTVKVRLAGRRVDVAGGVLGPHVEACAPRRSARRAVLGEVQAFQAAAVDAALEARAGRRAS